MIDDRRELNFEHVFSVFILSPLPSSHDFTDPLQWTHVSLDTLPLMETIAILEQLVAREATLGR